MNFSRHQERAERIGRRLLWLYAAAVLAVVAAANAAAALAWTIAWGGWFDYPAHFFLTNTLVLAGLIVGGSWVETSRLRHGGAALAEQLGAIAADPTRLLERRLINVVEEIAIAARVPVPRAYVLRDEPTINALAAGLEPRDGVVVVTAGALERLERAELQGVVAHEISHIVNGDMRLNTRLLGLNYGLELIALFGRAMMSNAVSGGFPKAASRSGVTRGGGPLAPFVLTAGAALVAVGAFGTWAARALKAAVGRQREFHADAQAVAFTRDRDGIGRALRKVAVQDRRGAQHAARVHPHWENVSHLLLAAPRSRWSWLSSHPPLRDRLRRLYGRDVAPLPADRLPVPAADREPDLPALAFVSAGDAIAGWSGLLPPTAASSGPADALIRATRELPSAAALVIALLQRPPVGSVDWPLPWREAGVAYPQLRRRLAALPPQALRVLRWPLIELSAARLRHAKPTARLALLALARSLVEADGRVTLSEWIAYTLLRMRIGPAPRSPAARAPMHPAQAVQWLFASVGWATGISAARSARAANSAVRALEIEPVGFEPDALALGGAQRAVAAVAKLAPLKKPLLMRRLAALITDDPSGDLDDLLRLLALAIDCPVPKRWQRWASDTDLRVEPETEPAVAET